MHALPPEKVAELRAKIATEREELRQKTDMAEEERNKAASELEKREQDVKESEYVQLPHSRPLCLASV